MINISRATVERQTRSYFEPRDSHPHGKVFYARDYVQKMPDAMRERLQSDAAFVAIGEKAHQEYLKYLAQHPSSQESLYSQYGKLTTDEEREAFIQKQVDKTMAWNEASNMHERRQIGIANRDTVASSADQSRNASERSVAIDMYRGVQNMGEAATTNDQGRGAAA